MASCIQSSPWGGFATKVGIIGGMNSSRPAPAHTRLRTDSTLGPCNLAARGTDHDHFTKLAMMHEITYNSLQPASARPHEPVRPGGRLVDPRRLSSHSQTTVNW
ncbi:hypothetical protein BQ8482_330160 [Mesorhizobium delmotii]|uniref:Uncharacterized protein n=1 Tax=Mesorhizobium delmotii TaxID=1631247 RepID=A0A2P9APE7_9HYPH|nr:hypothetical protein BQ8482_330160 [Mesorhizobium delmotii]